MDTDRLFERVKERLAKDAAPTLLGRPNEDAIIKAMLAAPNLGDRTWDRLEAEFGCTAGFFFTTKAIIRDLRAGQRVNPRSAAAARADRVLRVRDIDVLPTPKGEGFCFNGDAPEWVLLPLHMSRRPYSEHG